MSAGALSVRVVRLAAAIGFGAIAWGCTPAPASTGAPSGMLETVRGSVYGPRPGLVEALAAGVIASPAGGLVAAPGDGHSRYRVRHVVDLTVAEGRRSVSLVDLDGRTLSVKPAATDPDGNFEMTGLAVAGVAFVTVSFEREGRTVTLRSAVSSADGPLADVNVNPATTLVAHHLAARLRRGEIRPPAVRAVALSEAGLSIAEVLSPRAAVAGAVLPEPEAEAAYAAMLAESPALARAIAGAGAVTPTPGPSARP